MMFPPFKGFVRTFVLICGAVFLLESFATIGPFQDGIFFQDLIRFFGLTPELLFKGMGHQLITWIFIHGGLSHLLFNMFAFWMFGSALEEIWRTKRFMIFCFLSAIFSGLIVAVSGFFDPLMYSVPTIGASGVVFAILIAVSRLFPNQSVLVFFIFPMKLKYFAYLLIGIEFYALYHSNNHGISNTAHLSGALFGWLYVSFGGPSQRRRGPIGWMKEIYDRWHYQKMRKKIRVVKPEERNHWN